MIGVEADLEFQHKYVEIFLLEDAGEGVAVIFFTRMKCMIIGDWNAAHQKIGKVDVERLEVQDILLMTPKTVLQGLKNLLVSVTNF